MLPVTNAVLDCTVCLPLPGLYQVQPELNKIMQLILRLLQLNPFEKRDLIIFLQDAPFRNEGKFNKLYSHT